MKNDDLEKLFENLDFDVVQPKANHRERFKAKLKNIQKSKNHNLTKSTWALAIAASFLVAFILFQNVFTRNVAAQQDLASVSPQMETTQEFYASTIKLEIRKLQQHQTPQTETVITDALQQLKVLERDYNKLKIDLAQSGQDQRVVQAMIANFQQRLEVLNHVLETLKTINKKNIHENNLL